MRSYKMLPSEIKAPSSPKQQRRNKKTFPKRPVILLKIYSYTGVFS